ncbi:MAG: rod shape-determining protein, partial [Candidatus Binatia bacterium]
VGARLPVHEAKGSIMVDIGGGTTEISVISLGGIVVNKTLRTAGDELNDDIIQYARDHFNMLIGERTAENIKMKIGSAGDVVEPLEALIRGRDLVTGLPKEIIMNSSQTREAMTRSISIIVGAIKDAIEETPPELLSDIIEQGIYLAGGGALLQGLPDTIAGSTQIRTIVTDDPLTAVVRGTGIVLEDLEQLQEVLLPSVHGSELK